MAPRGAGDRRRGWSTASWRGGLVAVATAFAVSACGGDDAASSANPAPRTTAPSAVPTSSSPAENTDLSPADFVLTEGPATAGFAASAEEPADPEEQTDLYSIVAGCLGLPAPAPGDEPQASAVGPTFNSPDEISSIDSLVEIVSDEQVVRDRELLKNPRLLECLGSFYEQPAEGEPADSGIEIISVEEQPAPTGALAYIRAVMKLGDTADALVLSMDSLIFLEGNVEVTVNYVNTEQAAPRERLQQIADQISEKLRNR
ncbi:hypothetical protein [Parafrankia sp. FMc2]|uniref:hypothetical protein n=1 Tax=Parafrankia sp. FMc2 TaxID=3233196 RepID=UPI0034D75C39